MARIAYVNGRYRPLHEARVAVEDRGYQFADGVYELIKVYAGRPRDLERHLDRLERSLRELALPAPLPRRGLVAVLDEVRRRNGLRDGSLYLQITRGPAPRNQPFPRTVRPSLVVTMRRPSWPVQRELEQGVRVLTVPDLRWARCDIKSVSLLPNVLARQRATERGCREAWLYNAAGEVTEGSSSNAYIVDQSGRLITHPLTQRILGGVTRSVVLDVARGAGIAVEERPFRVAEAHDAAEAILTSTSSWVLPVTRIDDRLVGEGRAGPLARRLAALYRAHLEAA